MLFWILLILGIVFTLAVYFNLVSLNTRYVFLLILCFGVVASVFIYKLNPKYLGFNFPSFNSIIIFSLITLLACTVINKYNIKSKLNTGSDLSRKRTDTILFYFIFSAPLQEFLFRSYPLAMSKYLGCNSVVIYALFSASVFAFSHVFLRNKYIIIYTFLIGLVWSIGFYYYPNFLALSVSHFIIGVFLSPNKK